MYIYILSLRDDYVQCLFLYFLKLSVTYGQIDHAQILNCFFIQSKAGIKYIFIKRAGIRYPFYDFKLKKYIKFIK